MLRLVKYGIYSLISISSAVGTGWLGLHHGEDTGFDEGFHAAGMFLAAHALKDAPEPFIMVMPGEVRIECVLVPKEAPEGEDGYHPTNPHATEPPGALVGPGNAIPDPGKASPGNPNGRFKTKN